MKRLVILLFSVAVVAEENPYYPADDKNGAIYYYIEKFNRMIIS